MKTENDHWEVAVEAPIFEPLTYSGGGLDLSKGVPVEVPLGVRKVKGVVLGKSSKKLSKLKKVERIRDLPVLNKAYMDWIQWLSSYYVYPIGQIFKNTYPNLKRKTDIEQTTSSHNTENILNEAQSKIVNSINSQGFEVHLIHGITGSGKTEIYLKLIEKIEHQVLVLVPEISLTPQLVTRFNKKFSNVSVIHSQITSRQRTNQWWSVMSEKTKILIGARSAVFCPIQKIGLIIVDEEHDPSFKQNEGFRYNAKHAAIMLAKLHNCPIVLGSATPSIESWHNKKYKLHSLTSRFGNASLPKVTLEGMAKKKEDTLLPFWLSKTLFDKMNKHLSLDHQVALFLNRRGQSYLVCCTNCGQGIKCPNCSVSLIKHGDRHLICHYCNYHKNYTNKCDECNEDTLRAIGVGTEGIHNDLEKLFPNYKIIRADRDVVSTGADMREFIQTVEENRANILVGTQMISKGLNFPNLTLVGVVSLDASMNIPDFRAEEKTFQLLLQISGRAGRYGLQSEVVIQTFKPDDEILQMAAEYKYDSFFERELQIRRTLSYPPYGRLAMIRASSINEISARNAMDTVVEIAKKIRIQSNWFEILGPSPSPISKIRGKYRFQTLLKGKKDIKLYEICTKINKFYKGHRGVKLSFDIDPVNTL